MDRQIKAGLMTSGNEATIYGTHSGNWRRHHHQSDGQPVNEFEDLAAYLARYGEVGKTIQVTVLRNGKELQASSLCLQSNGKDIPVAHCAPRIPFAKVWLGITGIDYDHQIAAAMSLTSRNSRSPDR